MCPQSDARRVVERYLREVLAASGSVLPEDVISSVALLQRVRAFRRAFGDLEITPHAVLARGDFVAVHFSARGIHRGTFQGVQPTGRTWTASCSAIYRVDAGRIADFWATWDVLAILEQIGAVCRRPGVSA